MCISLKKSLEINFQIIKLIDWNLADPEYTSILKKKQKKTLWRNSFKVFVIVYSLWDVIVPKLQKCFFTFGIDFFIYKWGGGEERKDLLCV